MASKNKRNRLFTGRKGIWGEHVPDVWLDERGIEWVLCSHADFAGCIRLSPIEFAAAQDRLIALGLLERRTFTINGRERTGWRAKFAALELKLAMLEE